MQQCVVCSRPDEAAGGGCNSCCEGAHKHSRSSPKQISTEQVKLSSGIFVDFSLTEEFIRYIQAASTQADGPPALLEPPDGLRDQPVWVQDLWEKWVETIQAPDGDVQNGPRLETWFTNPRRWTRCDQSRVVVLSSNFTNGKENFWRLGLIVPIEPCRHSLQLFFLRLLMQTDQSKNKLSLNNSQNLFQGQSL